MVKLVLCLAVFIAVLAVASAEKQSFVGERVLRIHVNNTEYEKLNAFVEKFNLDVWASNAIEQYVDVRIPFHVMPLFQQLHLKWDTYIENVQALVDAEQARLSKRKGTKADYLEEYHTYEEVIQYWVDLARDYPSIVQTITIGTTIQNRQINGIRIRGRNPVKGFFFNGGQHAREWITVPTVQGIAQALVSGYGNNTEITNFIDNIEFTIVAPLNPDGYAYTWTNDRLWRKNREPNSGICVGTDTNRNWAYQWATGGSSAQPCSDTYHGPSALSSREAQAVDTYLKSRASAGIKYHGYIDFHAYSQLFMSPYGASNALPSDYSKHIAVLNDIASAILNSGFGTRYAVGPVYSTIYQASGGSNDHTYEINDVLYSFAAEGRDTGRYGFLLPEDQIQPSITENLNAVKVVARAILAI